VSVDDDEHSGQPSTSKRTENVEKIKELVHKVVLYSIKENDFHGAFEAWQKRWDHCICTQGDYFERDGSQN
jgi:hypothetical protein